MTKHVPQKDDVSSCSLGKEYTELESDRMARFASRYLEAARLVIRADLSSKPHCQRVLVPFREKETREDRTEFQSDTP